MKKAIIIGASSGIGKELAKVLSQNGYDVGLTGRRVELLSELQKEIPTRSFIKRFDVSNPAEAIIFLKELIVEMGGVDLIVISSGILLMNSDLQWERELETIMINVIGFTAMANVAFKYFCEQKSGHLVGISSIAALRGSDKAPAYPASKAFVSNYLEGLRKKASKLKLPITVTDIQPGYVDTAMTKAKGGRSFFKAPVEKAAQQIFIAIKKKKNHAYITKRWRLIAWVMRLMPGWLHRRI